jgi:lipopolysaccharide/colanic/teichoic acid biosynthesis glycosyltransferase
MQATNVNVIRNNSEGEVVKDMFEIKRANAILLSENDVTQEVLDKLEKGEEPKPTLPGKSGVTEYPILSFDDRALSLLHLGVSNTLKHTKVKPRGGKGFEFAKRAFDIVASAGALTVLALPIGVVALIIYLDDKGNPFFSQVRLTKDGKPFKMYKLRSMCMDAEARFAEVQKENQSDGLAFKSDDDPRVTRIGKFIRKTSIDELPQFFNVLRGDMSIIGPRPPLPREVVLYTPEQMDRLLVKGGLSCICQTEGRSDMEFDKWVEGDVRYIKTRSAGLDLKLMFKTAAAVILRKGAK